MGWGCVMEEVFVRYDLWKKYKDRYARYYGKV